MLDWEPVRLGRSGDVVRRSPGGSAYAKTGDVRGEGERLRWLASIGFPAPRVLDLDSSTLPMTLQMTLTMSAVPGIAMSALPATRAAEGLRAAMSMLRSLHEIPIDECPFDARLAVAVPRARSNVAAGLVDEDDFDDVRRGASAASLLDQLLGD